MPELNLLDKETIKELIDPVEKNQEKLNQLNNIYEIVNDIQKIRSNFEDLGEFSKSIEIIIKNIEQIGQNFKYILKSNLNVFLSLQDELYENYKKELRDSIQKSGLSRTDLKKLGLSLIENKEICRITPKITFLKTIGISDWIELLDTLKEITLFKKNISNLENFYQALIIKRLNDELEKIPPEIDKNLIDNFKTFFFENPNVPFKQYLNKIEEQDLHSELKARESAIRERREKEKLEELKKKQEERKMEYQDYLNLSEQEFERKIRKKKRAKLSDIVDNKKKENQLNIPDEVSEKIEKYKSKLDIAFKEKYLSIEEDAKEPIDLIRERKKKKMKEYESYKDHFDNV